MAAAIVPINADAKLPPKMPANMTPSEAWTAITSMHSRLRSSRREADKAATQSERLTGAVVDTVVGGTAAFLVPVGLNAAPKIKRIGKGKVFVDTQLLLAGSALVGGFLMAWGGWEGHRMVTAVGNGTAFSYAGIKGEQLSKEWFKKSA